jgi:hypothetical protein
VENLPFQGRMLWDEASQARTGTGNLNKPLSGEFAICDWPVERGNGAEDGKKKETDALNGEATKSERGSIFRTSSFLNPHFREIAMEYTPRLLFPIGQLVTTHGAIDNAGRAHMPPFLTPFGNSILPD